MTKKPKDEAASKRKEHTQLDNALNKAVEGQRKPGATDKDKRRHAANEANIRAALNKLRGM